VIVDPIVAAAGGLVPPASYYKRLRELCGDDVLRIFDEVLTGFGRTGHWFAADYYDVVPDIISLGKGSPGVMPLAATVATRRVAEPFLDGAVFQHIHTFGRAERPRVVAHALQQEQLLVRAPRDVVQIAPALIAGEEQLDDIVARLERSITAVVGCCPVADDAWGAAMFKARCRGAGRISKRRIAGSRADSAGSKHNQRDGGGPVRERAMLLRARSPRHEDAHGAWTRVDRLGSADRET
jgi:hypothetical protein